MSEVFFVFGGIKQDREKKITDIGYKYFPLVNNLLDGGVKKHADIMVLENTEEKRSIGIKEAKEISKFLQQKPFQSKHKLVVIPEAERLTEEAQNSLLKILEEPPVYGILVLAAPTERDLLETVISRCKKLSLKSGRVGDYEKIGREWLEKDLEHKFLWAEDLSKEEKDVMIERLQELISGIRQVMRKEKKNVKPIADIIETLTFYLKQLRESNVNPRLLLEAISIKTSD